MIKLEVEYILLFFIIIFLLYHLIKKCNCKNIECFNVSLQNNSNDDIGKNIYFIYVSRYFILHGNKYALQGLLKNEGKYISDTFDFSNELNNVEYICNMKKISDDLLKEEYNKKGKYNQTDIDINNIINEYITYKNFDCN